MTILKVKKYIKQLFDKGTFGYFLKIEKKLNSIERKMDILIQSNFDEHDKKQKEILNKFINDEK